MSISIVLSPEWAGMPVPVNQFDLLLMRYAMEEAGAVVTVVSTGYENGAMYPDEDNENYDPEVAGIWYSCIDAGYNAVRVYASCKKDKDQAERSVGFERLRAWCCDAFDGAGPDVLGPWKWSNPMAIDRIKAAWVGMSIQNRMLMVEVFKLSTLEGIPTKKAIDDGARYRS